MQNWTLLYVHMHKWKSNINTLLNDDRYSTIFVWPPRRASSSGVWLRLFLTSSWQLWASLKYSTTSFPLIFDHELFLVSCIIFFSVSECVATIFHAVDGIHLLWYEGHALLKNIDVQQIVSANFLIEPLAHYYNNYWSLDIIIIDGWALALFPSHLCKTMPD